MEVHGHYWLPGEDFIPDELDGFIKENDELTKIFLNDELAINEVCIKHGFSLLEKRKIPVLDLTKDLEQLWAEMDRKKRNAIRLAQKSNVKIRLAKPKDKIEFMDVYYHGYCIKHDDSAEHLNQVDSMTEKWIEREILYIATLEIEMATGWGSKIIAGIKIDQSKFRTPGEIVYYSANASLPEYLKFRPNDLLVWEAIQHSKKLGFKQFNMGGSIEHMFKKKFSKLEPQLVNEWARPSNIKNILFIVDSTFFQKRNWEDHQHINSIILEAMKYVSSLGIGFEIEEAIDCATETFYRSGKKLFRNAFYFSNRNLNDFWNGLSNIHSIKLMDGGTIADITNNKENKGVISTIEEWGWEKNSSHASSRENLKNELTKSLISGNNYRTEMLILSGVDANIISAEEIIPLFNNSKNPTKISIRTGKVLQDRGLLTTESIELNSEDFQYNDLLLRMASMESGISIEKMNRIFSKFDLIGDISKHLFLLSESMFAGKIFLNLDLLDKKSDSLTPPKIILAKWPEDLEVLEKWIKLDPHEHESWQMYSRALWNAKRKKECAQIAIEGLAYHPHSAHLLRRKAHGLRIDNIHQDAIEIELSLYESNPKQLNRASTLLYLIRSQIQVKDWNGLKTYSELGLELKPDNAEFKEAIILANKKLQ